MQAIRICHRMGARVIGTVGSAAKVETLLEEFSHLARGQLIVRSSGKAFGPQLDAALLFLQQQQREKEPPSSRGKQDGDSSKQSLKTMGIDLVLDSLQGDYFDPAFARLSAGGRHVVFGAGSMTPQVSSISVV